MAEEFNHIDDLIGKVLSGEASKEEVREFETWRSESAEHQEYFEDLQMIFSQAANNRVKINFDTEAAWQQVKSRLSKGKVVPISDSRFSYWPVIRIAAGILIAITIAVLGYRWYNQPVEHFEFTSFDHTTAQDTLPDGSTAFLNKKSSVVFEYNPKEKTRKVKLKGEGFFEVKHEETKPFVIEAEEALIRDIGTAFNVKSYPDKDTIEVAVQSGEVQFYTLNNAGLNLKAGETGFYSKKNKTFAKLEQIDTNVLAYKTGVLSFFATDLESAIASINQVYETHIQLGNEKISQCRLTATFNNEKLDHILEVIAESLSLSVETRDNGEIILTGPGCQ